MTCFDRAKEFLTDQALPFWSSVGAYPNGCFVECLDLQGRPVDPGFTRIRVQARQIYVFSHALHVGLYDAEDMCARATDFLIQSAWLGPELGWAKLIDRHGQLIDGSSDLYDISFALFALAWRYRISREQRLIEIAHQTLDFLDRNMRHPAGGYLNDASASFPRQQNPHMHLVEAMNAWGDACREQRFLDNAAELIGLFESRFSDSGTGALGEFFNEDWTPINGAQGDLVEPGHQFEWAWIIGHYGRLSGRPHHATMQRIIDFAMRHGFDERTGLTVDQVGRDGRVLAASRRLWPQTEALKACLASTEFLNNSNAELIARIVDSIFDRFLNPGPLLGTWIDHYNPDWTLRVNKVPTTSLYHVSLAFFELLRLRKEIEMKSIAHSLELT